MAKKLFIGNLAWATDDNTLKDAFSKFGEVAEAKVVFDRETGRSRGFGFVSYKTDEDAARAIEGMNGQALDGKNLRVDFATERTREGGGGGHRRGGFNRGER